VNEGESSTELCIHHKRAAGTGLFMLVNEEAVAEVSEATCIS